MKRSMVLMLVAATFVGAHSASAKIERTVSKRFEVPPGGVLTIDADAGAIRLTSTDEAFVEIDVHERIDASSEQEADELLRTLTLSIEQQDANVTVTARYERPRTFAFWRRPAVELTFVVKVPRPYHAVLKTSGGSIRVETLHGNLDARTSGGSLRLGKIEGDVSARTSGGGVHLESCTGKASLATSGGGLRLGKLGGPVEAKTSGGSIEIDEVNDVFNVRTSGGSIAVHVRGELKGTCEAETSGGSIRVTLDRSARFDLAARTSGGRVKTDFAVAHDFEPENKRKLQGKVNAGGPALKLRTSGGSIHVDAR